MATNLNNEPYGWRAQLLLGGFALALAALLAVVMATSEPPAPPLLEQAGTDHAAGVVSARGGRAAERDGSGAEGPLVDVQGALIAEKNAVLRELIAAVKEYARLRDAIYNGHPELEEIPGLLKRLARLPMERFPQGTQECQALMQQSPEMRGRLFELMVLKRADVVLAVLDDPKYGAYLNAVFETAGFNRLVAKDLTVLDTAAG